MTGAARDQPPRSEVTAGRLLRNTLINGVANASGAIVTIAITPFLLHRLGPAQYGIWLLALTLTFSNGYLALADLGLPEAAVRFIAEARAGGSTETINEIASSTTAVFTAIGLVAALVVVLLTTTITHLFGIGRGLAHTADIVFALMALGIVVDLPAAGLLAVIEGAQRYSWLRAIDVAGGLIWAGAGVIAIRGGHGVTALAVISLVTTAAEALAAFFVAHRVQSGLRIRLGLVRMATLRRTFSYGSKAAVLRVLAVVYVQMDRAIIGIALAVAALARYEIAYRIESAATLVLVTASSSVIPAAAYNAARADTDRQRALYLRGTKYAVALVAPVTLAAIIFARQLIIAWAGRGYASMAGATRLFLVFPLFWCVHQLGIAMFVGLGRIGPVIKLQLVSVGLNLALSIALVTRFGITGVILGTVIANAVTWLPYTRLFLAEFAISARDWLRRIVLPNLPGAVAQVTVSITALHWSRGLEKFWQVAGACAASVVVSLAFFALFGLGGSERHALLARARQS